MHYQEKHIKALLFEKLTGTISPKDEEWLDEVLKHSEEIKEEWHALEQKFKNKRASHFLGQTDPEAAWEKTVAKLKTNSKLQESKVPLLKNLKGRLGNYMRFGLSAACILFVIGAACWWINSRTEDNQVTFLTKKDIYIEKANGAWTPIKNEMATVRELLMEKKLDSSWNTLVVPPAKSYKLELADGTEVWLNAASRIRFRANFAAQKERRVFVEGEAFFKVAKNAAKPFFVQTPYAAVEVLGTSFNVKAYQKDEYVTSLVEGAVRSKIGQQTYRLKPGFQLVYKAGVTHITPFDEKEVCAWMQGLYLFKKQTLAEIIPVLERWFDVNVVLENKLLAHRQFTGAIDRQQTLQIALETLEISGNLKARREGHQVYLK